MSNFEINVSIKGETKTFDIGEYEEFPEAAKMAEYYLKENGIDDYSINSLIAVDGEYKGSSVKGENLDSLFISKDEILKGLQNGEIGIGFQDGSITAYIADNYFYFDSDFVNDLSYEQENLTDGEIADLYIKENTTYDIAEKIYACLEDFVTEFPTEYCSYKLALADKDSIKIENISNKRADIER